jgi:hypothetical protein
MEKEKSVPEKDAVDNKDVEKQPTELTKETPSEVEDLKSKQPEESKENPGTPSKSEAPEEISEEAEPKSEKIEKTVSAPKEELLPADEIKAEKAIEVPELKTEEKSTQDSATVEADAKSDPESDQKTQEDKPAKTKKAEKDAVIEEPVVEVKEESFNEFTRDMLIESLAETVNELDIPKIKKKVAFIKVAFLRENKIERDKKRDKFVTEGGKAEDYEHVFDETEEKFKVLFDVYKQNKARFNKSQEELKLKNLELKKKILEELKELNNSEETLKKTYDEFKILQDRWKEIGIVPQSEINNLWQSYHFLVEMFFDKVKINKELRDLDLKKNLELKVEICEKTEELLLEPSITKSFKDLQHYHEQWKKVGPVPMDVKEDIWERFKQATDKINERRREFYGNLHVEQKGNLDAKTILCEQAEELLEVELSSLKEWQEQTEKINKLLETWKTIGPAPKKNNDEIWKRFKSSLNGFFDNKKEFYSKLKEQQLNNYNKKLDLCLQSEGLKESEDWKKTTIDLINLQKEWKTIGPVPKKYSDKVWKRFRAACDEFFNNKASYYSNIHVHEEKNFVEKKELIEKIKDFNFEGDKKQNLQVFKDFQRQWMKIGHVPIKEKEKLQADFRNAINTHLEHLKINQVEINTMNYKSKIENMSEGPGSRNAIYKERNFLTNKISKMKEDVNLWENNMGFFADSKNASLLKVEFEKKIENAKKELALMEAKLKVINNTEIR